jgi:septum site-determining protein MinC
MNAQLMNAQLMNAQLMNAQFILAAAGSGCPHRLLLADQAGDPLELVRQLLTDAELQGLGSGAGPLRLECGERRLGASCLAAINSRLAQAELGPITVSGAHPLTRVAAAAIGLEWVDPITYQVERARPLDQSPQPGQKDQASQGRPGVQPLTLHRGPVRSGDHIEAAGSLLVLGDVNPGGRVSAVGHVLVWGRLRGIAHAGCRGDQGARIVALGLQPLQLRIADAIARGPQEAPPAGLAEQASLRAGAIRIDPASPSWPLG